MQHSRSDMLLLLRILILSVLLLTLNRPCACAYVTNKHFYHHMHIQSISAAGRAYESACLIIVNWSLLMNFFEYLFS